MISAKSKYTEAVHVLEDGAVQQEALTSPTSQGRCTSEAEAVESDMDRLGKL